MIANVFEDQAVEEGVPKTDIPHQCCTRRRIPKKMQWEYPQNNCSEDKQRGAAIDNFFKCICRIIYFAA